MREILTYHTLRPAHLKALELQPSQGLALGLQQDLSDDEMEAVCAMPMAWCVKRGGVPLACFGIFETFADRQGWGWANLAAGIGADHCALTRFVKAEVAGRALPRTEVLCRAPDLETEIAQLTACTGAVPDSGQLVALAMARPSPEMRWAVLLGLRPAHVLRCYGAAGETYMLFERIDTAAMARLQESG